MAAPCELSPVGFLACGAFFLGISLGCGAVAHKRSVAMSIDKVIDAIPIVAYAMLLLYYLKHLH